jgi:hypothetical protein
VDLNTYKKKEVMEAIMQRIATTLNSIDVATGIFVSAELRVFLSTNNNPSNVKRKKMLAIKIRNIALFRVNGLRAVSIALQRSSMSI